MSEEILLRLRKTLDGNVLGPFPLQTLQQYAQSALVGPDDMVDFLDDNWKPAAEVPELEMCYIITSKANGNCYGPTTRGTIREFLVSGELAPDDIVENSQTKEIVSVQDFLGSSVVFPTSQTNLLDEHPLQSDSDGELPPAVPQEPLAISSPTNPDLVAGQELAKDLKIHQLQTDLNALRVEYDNLLHKYRQLTEKSQS